MSHDPRCLSLTGDEPHKMCDCRVLALLDERCPRCGHPAGGHGLSTSVTATVAGTTSPARGQSEYRIEYTITRRDEGEDDFTEIGFGSTGAWDSLDQCAHMLGSAVQCREWETEPGQPDPSEVDQ